MLAAIPAILAIINKFVKDPQQQAQIAAQVQATFWQYQSDFISKTSDILNRILRVTIVGIFVAGLFYAPLAQQTIQSISALGHAGAAGLVYLSIILWEFYGAAALQILPWFKGQAGTAVIAIAGNDPIPSPASLGINPNDIANTLGKLVPRVPPSPAVPSVPADLTDGSGGGTISDGGHGRG